MKFTDSHEWIDVKNGEGTVGITPYAAKELGEVVYVELPKVGHRVKARTEACVLESTKAAADVYSPVSGTITAVNETLKNESGLVNSSPLEKGWLYRIQLDDSGELEALMDEKKYQEMIQ